MGRVCFSTECCSELAGKCEMFLQNISVVNGKRSTVILFWRGVGGAENNRKENMIFV